MPSWDALQIFFVAVDMICVVCKGREMSSCPSVFTCCDLFFFIHFSLKNRSSQSQRVFHSPEREEGERRRGEGEGREEMLSIMIKKILWYTI